MHRNPLFAATLLLLIFAMPALGQDLSDQHLAEDPFQDEYFLLLALNNQRYQLSSGLPVYQTSDDLYIPLQEFVSALGFAIDVDPDAGSAQGWFFTPEQSFRLDKNSRKLFLKGKEQTLPNALIIANDGFDLYIPSEYLESWFGIRIDLRLQDLSLEVSSQQEFPSVANIVRTQKRKTIDSNQQRRDRGPVIADNYDLLGTPSTDITLSSSLVNDENESSYSIISAMDTFGHSMQTYFSGSSSNSKEARIQWSKSQLQENQALTFGLSEYKFGDVVASGEALVQGSALGVGLALIKKPEGGSVFDVQQITGSAPPGWQAELYINRVLVDFQDIDDTGRYLFASVPLQFGTNNIDVKLYGPQGQEEVESYQYNIDNAMSKPGGFSYQFYYAEEAKSLLSGSLIGLQLNDENTTINGKFLSAEADYGLNTFTSLSFGLYSSKPSDNLEQELYQKFAVTTAFSKATTQAKWINQSSGGSISAFNIASSAFFDAHIKAEYRHLDNFVSRKYANQLIQDELTLSMIGSFRPRFMQPVFYRVSSDTTFLTNQTERYELKSNLVSNISRFRVDNELILSKFSRRANINANGVFGVRSTGSAYRWRLSTDYIIDPEPVANTLALSLELRPRQTLNYFATAQASLVSGADSLSLGLNRQFELFKLSVAGKVTNTDNYEVMLTLNSNYFPGTDNTPSALSSYGSSNSGKLLVHVFIDHNNNKVFDDEDEPLSDVKFSGVRHWRDISTDQSGYILLDGLSSGSPQAIQLVTKTIEDPYLKAHQEKFQIISHPASLQRIEIPVAMTTEIEGYAYIQKGEKQIPASGSSIVISASDGSKIETIVGFDGFYYIDRILAGEYRIEISQAGADLEKFIFPTPILLRANSQDGVNYVDELIIKVKAQP